MFKSYRPVIVELSKNDLELGLASQEANADAVMLQVLSQKQSYVMGGLEEELENVQNALAKISIKKGLLMGDVRSINKDEWEQIKKLGFDFFSVYPRTAPSFILESRTPKLINVQTGLPIEYYRALSHISSVEGFVFTSSSQNKLEPSINFVDLAVLEILTTNLAKPVYLRLNAELDERELRAVLERGIYGLILDPYDMGVIDPIELKEIITNYKKLMEKSEYKIWM